MIAVDTQPQKRAAVYIRTKGKCDEQNAAYQLQLTHYTGMIEKEPSLTLAGVYTDGGCSSLRQKRREGFDRMIADALDGKIDIIIVKSLSRFSRNTEEALVVVHQLKEKGIEVVFEQEGFSTFDYKTTELLALMDELSTFFIEHDGKEHRKGDSKQ